MVSSVSFCVLILALFYISFSDGGLPGVPREESLDPCTTECLRRVSVSSNAVGGSESCARGCRFFTLATLIGDKQVEGKSIKSQACKAMCQESYGDMGFDATSCKTGCESSVFPMNFQVPVIAEFSWSWFIDDSKHVQSGDIPELDDVLTDPGLRSQISRLETLRIPEMRLHTMPVMQEKTVDEKGLCGGGTVRGIPFCLVWSLLLLLTLLGLWSCLSLEESRDDLRKVLVKDDCAPPLPDKVPLLHSMQSA
ncbi:hypothetical protein GE061_007947 [Apolygus lucorum]|uniref:Uncharacterized protein n=1 Tax=Apolygus lucorum TaxID=248454 RepID=A0A6A4IPW0_APOLU|nr:hypothetical protein GE061_007947 [Apolygus lucorum]